MKLPPIACPWCDTVCYEADCTDGGPSAPEPDAVMICEACANISVFVAPGLARRAEGEERMEILMDPAMVREIMEVESRLRK